MSEATAESLRAQRRLNQYFGGRAALLSGLAPLLDAWPHGRKRLLRVCDVGCGCGDLPIAIAQEAQRRGFAVHVLAVERDALSAAAARRETAGTREITVIEADALDILGAAARGASVRTRSLGNKAQSLENEIARARPFHIVTACSFLRFLSPREVLAWLGLMNSAALLGWVATDHERDVLAWAGRQMAARHITGDHELSWRLRDWQAALARAGFADAAAERRRPGRVILYRNKRNSLSSSARGGTVAR